MIVIRALGRSEAHVQREVFEAMSPWSRFLRFHTGLPRLSDTMLERLTNLGPGRGDVFVAEDAGRPVGISRWVRDARDPDRAEIALEVVDGHHGRGIGTRLATAAVQAAIAARVGSIYAHVHPDNQAVHRMLAQASDWRAVDSEEWELLLPVAATSG